MREDRDSRFQCFKFQGRFQ